MLDDGSGRVRVEPGADLSPGSDERVWLVDGAGRRVLKTAPGSIPSELLVIGEFVPPDLVRPWKPPFGRVLQSVVDRFVDETLQREADQSWNRIGFGSPSELFLVTNMDEPRAKRRLLGAWRRVLLLGALLLASAVLLLTLAARSWP